FLKQAHQIKDLYLLIIALCHLSLPSHQPPAIFRILISPLSLCPFYQFFLRITRVCKFLIRLSEYCWLSPVLHTRLYRPDFMQKRRWTLITYPISIHLHFDISIILFYLFLPFSDRLTYVPGGPYLLFLDSCWTLTYR